MRKVTRDQNGYQRSEKWPEFRKVTKDQNGTKDRKSEIRKMTKDQNKQ